MSDTKDPATSVTHVIDVQYASMATGLPDQDQLTCWANAALDGLEKASELSIRIVDEEEAARLNQQWRHSAGPTNVLSFPAELPVNIEPRLLGDIVICAPVIASEADQQEKTAEAHWAHMVIHGTLHLLGYDHIEGHEARVMESLEIDILDKLKINNPYN